jgi:trimeric autotransporter adhesin
VNVRARGTAALLAAAGLITGLLTGAPAAVAATSPGTITTVAGGPGSGPATKVFQVPQGLAAGPGGALYVGDNFAVRQFSSTGSVESVVAGNGGNGYGGDGGPATTAQVGDASGLAVDSSGNLVIADSVNCRIRVVAHSTGTFYGQAMTAGDIYTVAGNGTFGFSGDGGPATAAKLGFSEGAAVDAAGNLLIADTDNGRIRVVAATTGTFYGQAMTAGDIYTVAGGGTAGLGDGGPATKAEVGDPYGVTVDSAGNVLIPDSGNDRIRVVAATTGTFYGQAMTAGDIYTVAGGGTAGLGDGGPATAAELDSPTGVAPDPAGNLVIADFGNARVRVVAERTGTFYGQAMTAGDIYTVAGNGITGTFSDGGLATATHLSQPRSVTFDAAGNLLIADSGYDRVWAVPAKTSRFYGRPMTAHHIYFVAGNGRLGFSGSGGKATNAQIHGNYAFGKVTVDGSNWVVVSAQQAWFIANKAGTHFGRPMTAGHIYSVAGDGFKGYAGDGGIATSARFANPDGVAVDRAGNLVIADTGNDRVRVVAAKTGRFYGLAMTAGDVYTVAGGGTTGLGDGGPATAAEVYVPRGVAVDGSGNLVIADNGDRRIRVVAATTGTFYGQAMTAGDIYTVAGNGGTGFGGDGGPATAARVTPYGVAVDRSGNLVIAAATSNRIRVVAATTGTFYGQAMTAGDIYRVAGTGTLGFSGDGGPATAAKLWFPQSVAVDGSGNLIIADSENWRIRVVAAASGTFYGVAMTAGDIYTVAGNGTAGSSGDGGPATAAELFYPSGVAVGGAGNLVIDDSGNGRVREVTG